MPRELIAAHARAMGVEQRTRNAAWKIVEREFNAEHRTSSCTHIVFGEIELHNHRNCGDRVCVGAGVEPPWPPRDEPREALVEEFWKAGFRAVVVCVPLQSELDKPAWG